MTSCAKRMRLTRAAGTRSPFSVIQSLWGEALAFGGGRGTGIGSAGSGEGGRGISRAGCGWPTVDSRDLTTVDRFSCNSTAVAALGMTIVSRVDMSTVGRLELLTVGLERPLEIRCDPTPLPTAGEKMRSSSSLGSKAGCFLLDRDAFAMQRLNSHSVRF